MRLIHGYQLLRLEDCNPLLVQQTVWGYDPVHAFSGVETPDEEGPGKESSYKMSYQDGHRYCWSIQEYPKKPSTHDYTLIANPHAMVESKPIARHRWKAVV